MWQTSVECRNGPQDPQLISTASRSDNGQPHSSGALVCSIRCSNACERLSLLTWCFPSLFHPHFSVQTHGCLATQGKAMDKHSVLCTSTHTHIKTHLESILKEKDNVLPLQPSTMHCDPPENVKKKRKPLCLEEI